MLDIKNCLLVVIDIQDKLVKAGFNGDLCEEKAAKICKAANILNIPTIITEQYPKGLGHSTDTIMANTANNIHIIEKTSFSAYSESEFQQELNKSLESIDFSFYTFIDFTNSAFNVFVGSE